MQTSVGRLKFCLRALPYDLRLFNLACDALEVARYLQCTREKAMKFVEMAADLQFELWSPLVWSPYFSISGEQSISSSASTSLPLSWGVHTFGVLACGVWTNSVLKLMQSGRISINPLELLAYAVAYSHRRG